MSKATWGSGERGGRMGGIGFESVGGVGECGIRLWGGSSYFSFLVGR